MIGDRELPDLKVLVERHEVARAGLDAQIAGADDAVTQAMASGVVLDIGARGLPRGRPEFARVVVAQINVAAAEIEGNVVIAVTRDAPQAPVAVEDRKST